jgi:hypothetical protein
MSSISIGMAEARGAETNSASVIARSRRFMGVPLRCDEKLDFGWAGGGPVSEGIGFGGKGDSGKRKLMYEKIDKKGQIETLVIRRRQSGLFPG